MAFISGGMENMEREWRERQAVEARRQSYEDRMRMMMNAGALPPPPPEAIPDYFRYEAGAVRYQGAVPTTTPTARFSYAAELTATGWLSDGTMHTYTEMGTPPDLGIKDDFNV